MRLSYCRVFVLVAILSLLASCAIKNEKNQLIIFHAGSLSLPLKQIANSYMEEHPEVEVLLEAAGSRTCARKISELDKPCDLFLSSDYKVIESILMPKYAACALSFATNEVVLVVAPEFQQKTGIDAENWREILLTDAAVFGRGDPEADPCGYRTLMLFQLEGLRVKDASFYDKIAAKNREMIRPKAEDLIALFQSGEIDGCFEYRSVAEQHHMPFIQLSDSVSLCNPFLANFYENAKVEVAGKKPGERVFITGSPIIYALTLPTTGENHEEATRFLHFFLNKKKGVEILEKNGQASLNYDADCLTRLLER